MMGNLFIKGLNDPDTMARHRAAKRFLDQTVFVAIPELYPWFDSAEIKHFGAKDFLAVIDRCTRHRVLLIGVEVFTPQAELLTVQIAESGSDTWCVNLVDQFRDQPELSFCATYDCERAIR